MWVSLADAAKKQKVSRQAVHKRVGQLVADGRLTVRDGPRGTKLINLVAYRRAVNEETDPAQHLRNRTEPELFGVADEEDAPAPPTGSGQRQSSYHDARAQREAFNAENARLDLEERRGNLVDRDEVDRRQMEIFRRLRDRLLQLPATSAPRLVSQPDERAVRVMLDKDIRSLLDKFADELDRMAEADGIDVTAE